MNFTITTEAIPTALLPTATDIVSTPTALFTTTVAATAFPSSIAEASQASTSLDAFPTGSEQNTTTLPNFNVQLGNSNITSANATSPDTLNFDEPHIWNRIGAVSTSVVLVILVAIGIFRLLRKTDTLRHSSRHQKYWGISAVCSILSQFLFTGMAFRAFRYEDQGELEARGLISILYYASTSFLVWSALFTLVLASLQRLQEFKPRYAESIINIRVASFGVSCVAFLVDVYEYCTSSRHNAILIHQGISLIWLLVVCIAANSIMVSYVCPIRLSGNGSSKLKKPMVYFESFLYMQIWYTLFSIVLKVLAIFTNFHSASAAAALFTNALMMFSRFTSSKVLDLIDKGYSNMEEMAKGEVGVLHTDGRVQKKVEFADAFELTPVKGSPSPYGEVNGVHDLRLDDSQFQIGDDVDGPEEDSFI
jgi:hypothetical protein